MRPEVTWSTRTTVWGLLAGLFLAVLIAPLLVVPFDPDLSSVGATLAAQALLTAALIGTAIYIARRPEPLADLRTALSRLGWRPFKPRALAQMLLMLVIFYAAIVVYSAIVGEPHQEDIGDELGLCGGPVLAAIALLMICVVAPVAEETFFRGFLYGGLRQRLSELPAATISGLVFGFVHAPTGPTAIIPLAFFGIGLALLYERTGSIWPGVLAHVINNSLAITSQFSSC
jgi:membrane protease YdiL (CAAX protease family)